VKNVKICDIHLHASVIYDTEKCPLCETEKRIEELDEEIMDLELEDRVQGVSHA
jgi:hypothetical protein